MKMRRIRKIVPAILLVIVLNVGILSSAKSSSSFNLYYTAGAPSSDVNLAWQKSIKPSDGRISIQQKSYHGRGTLLIYKDNNISGNIEVGMSSIFGLDADKTKKCSVRISLRNPSDVARSSGIVEY